MGIFSIAIAIIPLLAVNEMRKSGTYTTVNSRKRQNAYRSRRRRYSRN